MTDSVFYTGALAVTTEEIKMLKSFCKDFGINITINEAGTGIVLENPTEIQKVLLQGFYYGLSRQHLELTPSELGKCSNPTCNRPATRKVGDYPFCDECLTKK
ncbi:hypothetical protein L0244_39410 [bacterium]|nr:hypothetical protein [bacterium]MCI0619078.1 hypothetical protein [bacterium]